jgi:hypothetical protein
MTVTDALSAPAAGISAAELDVMQAEAAAFRELFAGGREQYERVTWPDGSRHHRILRADPFGVLAEPFSPPAPDTRGSYVRHPENTGPHWMLTDAAPAMDAGPFGVLAEPFSAPLATVRAQYNLGHAGHYCDAAEQAAPLMGAAGAPGAELDVMREAAAVFRDRFAGGRADYLGMLAEPFVPLPPDARAACYTDPDPGVPHAYVSHTAKTAAI